MPKTKDVNQTVSKWKRVTPTRTEDYLQGVENPLKDWAENTKSAEANYKLGVTAAANAGRFGKGVTRVGTTKWQEKTILKGRDRWPAGIAIAESDYAAGIAPVLDVIARTDVGPQYPKGDPRNIQRCAKMAEALHKHKISR